MNKIGVSLEAHNLVDIHTNIHWYNILTNSQCVVTKMYAKDHMNTEEEETGIFGKEKKSRLFREVKVGQDVERRIGVC